MNQNWRLELLKIYMKKDNNMKYEINIRFRQVMVSKVENNYSI